MPRNENRLVNCTQTGLKILTSSSYYNLFPSVAEACQVLKKTRRGCCFQHFHFLSLQSVVAGFLQKKIVRFSCWQVAVVAITPAYMTTSLNKLYAWMSIVFFVCFYYLCFILMVLWARASFLPSFWLSRHYDKPTSNRLCLKYYNFKRQYHDIKTFTSPTPGTSIV